MGEANNLQINEPLNLFSGWSAQQNRQATDRRLESRPGSSQTQGLLRSYGVKAQSRQQTFSFDDEPEEPPVVDAWSEVPPARFLAWSNAEQLLYCAVRDEDSASHADTPEEAAWYRQRAADYQAEYRRGIVR